MKVNKDLIRNVKGFLDVDEGRCLYDIALKAGSLGPCLEIGSYCGKSTLYLAAACRENSRITIPSMSRNWTAPKPAARVSFSLTQEIQKLRPTTARPQAGRQSSISNCSAIRL